MITVTQVFMFDDIRISINLKQDLSSATGTKILYKKPDGTVGEWTGTVSGETLYFDCVLGEIDQPGHWQFEGRAVISGKQSSGILTLWVDQPLDV